MRIEAFSEAKRPEAPDTNEDALLILPGRAYAVLDGVTDRIGSRYDGVLGGRYAAQLLQRTLEQELGGADAPLDDPWAIVELLVGAIRASYDRLGITEQVRTDWNRQMASTLALVTLSGGWAHVVRVGDSGVRLNGRKVLREEKDLDVITAALRRCAWGPICARVADPSTREHLSRAVVRAGTRHAEATVGHVLRGPDLDAVEEATLAFCRAHLGHVAEVDLRRMVQGGILNGQGSYQNNADSTLGYPSLNGFDIPRGMIRVETLPIADLHSIELFTDGYFAPGDGSASRRGESMFAHIERVDPHKIEAYPSPKGSVDGLWADDRTYLGVQV